MCFGQLLPGFNPFTCSVSPVDYQNICVAEIQAVACSSIDSVCTFFQIIVKCCELRFKCDVGNLETLKVDSAEWLLCWC